MEVAVAGAQYVSKKIIVKIIILKKTRGLKKYFFELISKQYFHHFLR